MRRHAIILALLAAAAAAQQTVAPSTENVGPPLGRNVNGYNIVNSFETGYRFHSVHGDLGKYRSDVNFGNGVRLLGSLFTVHSREGHGHYFDEIVLRTQGLGNDPYQYSTFRVQKNRFYRYDLSWREDQYFNPAARVAFGLHALDTSRRFQDHDITILPQARRIKLFAGYSRNSQEGPALATTQGVDLHGDLFGLVANVRRLRNEYRVGSEINLLGLKFTWLRGWDNFSETTPQSLERPDAGIIPNRPATLQQFRRSEPYSGSSPYWRLNLHTEKQNWAAYARYTYVGGRRDYFFDETAVGTTSFGTAQNRQILVAGNGRRPVSAGNLTLSVFPGSRLTIANQTSFHHTRMDGDATFRQIDPGFTVQIIDFRFLGIRAITNTTDVTLRATKAVGIYGGYHYSTRRIRSNERTEVAGRGEAVVFDQTNVLNDGLIGVRLQPVHPLTINLEGEIGRADRPVFPISDLNYHALGARVQYRAGTLLLAVAARSNYNTNSVTLSSHSSRARNYTADASWSPRGWVAFDAGYSKLHLDTLSGIAFFALGNFEPFRGQSIYLSNLHTGNLMARFGLGRRADLSVGYTRVEDAGAAQRPRPTPAAEAVFLAAQTFPLAFESPLARFSVRLHQKLRFNLGYQFYHYREDFSLRQNYRAHTGFTSVLWSF